MLRKSPVRLALIIPVALLAFPLALSQVTRPQQSQQKSERKQEVKQPPAQSPPGAQEQENIVRISTQLVQIDATVTDKKGEHVEDLSESDFELMVDGKKQPITYFRHVKLPEAKRDGAAPAGAPKTISGSGPPARAIAPEQVRRTIAFVVDDLGLSFGRADSVGPLLAFRRA